MDKINQMVILEFSKLTYKDSYKDSNVALNNNMTKASSENLGQVKNIKIPNKPIKINKESGKDPLGSGKNYTSNNIDNLKSGEAASDHLQKLLQKTK